MLPPAYNEIVGKQDNQVVNRLPPVHTLTCPHGDLLSFWRAPTKKDIEYVSPYATYGPVDKYVTFEPDFGGWNNIRMQMELILVFALATGRTLVLPPDQPMYLLHHGKGHQKVHSFADFFPFDIIDQRVKVISMKEYLEKEGLTNHLSIIPKQVEFDMSDKLEKNYLWRYLRNVSSCPLWKCMTEYLIIPKEPDELMDRYYKRFVRDYVHYVDTIFCKAAVIIKHLLDEGNGSFTSFHIRRGEFQYKEVKISASELMRNVGHLIPSNELLYLATDEKNKSFFNDMLVRFPKIRYLDDYIDTAGLVDINPNYLGMIDQVVCTRGTQFIGTWFSTFSGYITRMRGYLGYHDYSVWYGDKTRRDRFHHAELPKFPFYMREWNLPNGHGVKQSSNGVNRQKDKRVYCELLDLSDDQIIPWYCRAIDSHQQQVC
eukprot:gene18978-24790_t